MSVYTPWDSVKITKSDDTNSLECLWYWEVDDTDYDQPITAGGLANDLIMDNADLGRITDVVDPTDALFCVFEAYPEDVVDPADDIEWPEWAVRYIEYACLERAYGADTDGFIPSLRDYWKTRKEIGIRALKKYRALKMRDRDFRLGAQKDKHRSRLRLPAGYPAVYP